MAEQSDTDQEKVKEWLDKEKAAADATSGLDYEAQSKHFQAIADRRDAENKSLREERDSLKAAEEARKTDALKEQEKYKELSEQMEAKATAAEKARESLALKVELQTFLAEKHPDYAPDFRWISPHVDSKENIASVVEDYVKAHPKSAGMGTASPGNRGTEEGGQKTISAAELNDPAKHDKLLAEDPKLMDKLASGELKVV
jgi:hypothetical protein